MKRIRRSSWAVILILLYYVSTANGRMCYHCDSRGGDCLEDSVNGTNIIPCAEGNDYCQVVKDGRHAGGTRFIRDCVNECDKEFVKWSKDGEEYCHMCCDEDGCNSGRCEAALFLLGRWLLGATVIVTFGILP